MKQLALALSLIAAPPVFAAQQIATLAVEGMDCPACPITVKKSLQKVSGVKAVKVDFAKKQATVTYDDTQATLDKLTQATKDAGYPSQAKTK